MNRLSTFALVLMLAGCETGAPSVDTEGTDVVDTTADSGEADTVEVDADEDTSEPDTGDVAEPDVVPDVPEPDTPETDAVETDGGDPDAVEDAPEPDAVDDTGEADVSEDIETDLGEDTEPDTPSDTEPDVATYCGAEDSAFPDFRTGCAVADDCSPAFHQVDCCGTEGAIAVLSAMLGDFRAAEARCRDEYPTCRCLAGATETDDGVVVDSLDDFDVACERGVCVSVGRGVPDVVCEDRIPTTFPAFDNSCVEYDDCIAVPHQTDCCGNQHMVGINRDYAEEFGNHESSCRDAYPLCGCPVGRLSTDSGAFAPTPDIVEAQCRGGVCWTYVPL